MRKGAALPPRDYPVRELVERLEDVYGRARHVPRFTPVEELVSCILSQHTSDANSFPAFTKLLETFPDWQSVVAAGPERVAGVVRGAGLANQKGRSIVAALRAIKEQVGHYSLDHLSEMPILEAREWLVRLPGVGPKTASIVLCFSFGMGTIPVDTHVFRVSWRLGLIPQTMGEARAHDALLALVPEELAYRFHVALIQHGRQICRAPLPLCEKCPVRDLCDWYKSGGPTKREAELRAARSSRAGAGRKKRA